MKIVVEGCAHGELDKIYESIQYLEEREGFKVDLLLCCGDFQAVRNKTDLLCMAVPPKYRQMQTFYKYYSGEKKAPILTIFIGGNHEASNHLWELPHGGWVAPNIYYLGYSGVVQYGGFRIAGLSGIYKSHDYPKGHFECPPYDNSSMRSAYHIRNFDVFKLKLLMQPLDIMMSHDWPQGVYHHGNVDKLYKFKSFLKPEIESNTLGSPPAGELLYALQPTYWFSAHLHVKFPALIPHGSADQESTKYTKFLALDKCLPRRDFLQVIDVGDPKGPLELCYDPEWLAVTKLTDLLTNITPSYTVLPMSKEEIAKYKPNAILSSEVAKLFSNDLKVPCNFTKTVEPFDPAQPKKKSRPVGLRLNPQTAQFCQALGISNSFFPGGSQQEKAPVNPDEIDLSDEDDGVDNDGRVESYPANPDEINLGEDEDEEDTNKPCAQDHNILWDEDSLSKPEGMACLSNVLDDESLKRGDNDDNESVVPNKKVIKLCRRNQALYTPNDDEQDIING